MVPKRYDYRVAFKNMGTKAQGVRSGRLVRLGFTKASDEEIVDTTVWILGLGLGSSNYSSVLSKIEGCALGVAIRRRPRSHSLGF